MSEDLNDRQKRFVLEYLKDLNATQAAIRAGYSERTAEQTASRLLSHVKVSAAIENEQAERAQRVKVTLDQILDGIDDIAYQDPGDIFDFSGDDWKLRKPKDIPACARRTISAIEIRETRRGDEDGELLDKTVKVRFWDKNAAARLALQHRGKLVEKVAPTDPTGTREYRGELTDEEIDRRLAYFLEQIAESDPAVGNGPREAAGPGGGGVVAPRPVVDAAEGPADGSPQE